MEEEIDLRIYLDILLKWWWLIILGAAVVGAGAFLVSSLMPPVYEASAGVVRLRSQAEISLGSGFQTITEESSDPNMAYNAADLLLDRNTRLMNSLVGMVQNGAIANQVAAELKDILEEEERDPTILSAMVRGELFVPEDGKGNSDTIRIIVTHTDPVKAAAIANAWAKYYEQYVNQIYGDVTYAPFLDIETQVKTARGEYDVAHEALLKFLDEDDRAAELQRQITEEEAIIERLRSGRQTTISTLIDKEVETRQRLINAYLEDDTTNRLFAFNKGQEAKRQILTTWIDAEIANRMAAINRDRDIRLRFFNTEVATEIDSKVRVFEHRRDELYRNLEQDYARKHTLEDLLKEARLMREQVAKGGEASAKSTGLALVAFKARIFNADSGLPFNELNLEMTSVDALSPNLSAAQQLNDLDGLIAAMEEEIAALETSIATQSEAMLQGEGYDFLDLLSPEYLSISASESVSPTEASALTQQSAISPSLSTYILARYDDLFKVGDMALSARDIATDTELFAEISTLYPELFAKDAWMEFSESVGQDTELRTLANQMADDFLNMKGWDKILAYSTLDLPLTQEIVRRENNVRSLQAEIVRLDRVRADLQQDNDLAWQAYSTLLAKAQEVSIAASSEGSEVRFASQAVPPHQPASPKKMMNTAIGLAVGLIGGVVCAFLFNYLGLESNPRALWLQWTKKKAPVA